MKNLTFMVEEISHVLQKLKDTLKQCIKVVKKVTSKEKGLAP